MGRYRASRSFRSYPSFTMISFDRLRSLWTGRSKRFPGGTDGRRDRLTLKNNATFSYMIIDESRLGLSAVILMYQFSITPN